MTTKITPGDKLIDGNRVLEITNVEYQDNMIVINTKAPKSVYKLPKNYLLIERKNEVVSKGRSQFIGVIKGVLWDDLELHTININSTNVVWRKRDDGAFYLSAVYSHGDNTFIFKGVVDEDGNLTYFSTELNKKVSSYSRYY